MKGAPRRSPGILKQITCDYNTSGSGVHATMTLYCGAQELSFSSLALCFFPFLPLVSWFTNASGIFMFCFYPWEGEDLFVKKDANYVKEGLVEWGNSFGPLTGCVYVESHKYRYKSTDTALNISLPTLPNNLFWFILSTFISSIHPLYPFSCSIRLLVHSHLHLSVCFLFSHFLTRDAHHSPVQLFPKTIPLDSSGIALSFNWRIKYSLYLYCW